MTVARVGRSAVLLQNGEVLVAGGDGGTPATAELRTARPEFNLFRSFLVI